MPHKAEFSKFTLLGGGTFGTALAWHLGVKGFDVGLWCLEPEIAEGINTSHRNPVYLKDAKLPPTIRATTDMAEALDGAEAIVSVVPAQVTRKVWEQLRDTVLKGHILPVLAASKGIETSTAMTLEEVFRDVWGDEYAPMFCAFSGPTFAVELARGVPTVAVVASRNAALASRFQVSLAAAHLRLYTQHDVVGVELGGALKNVIAIAAGVCVGLKFGHNSIAALITRGLAEMTRLGVAMGADPATFSGLAGMGDLVLTCTGELSRNRTVGQRLGEGKKLPDILKELGQVAEGVETTRAAIMLADKYNVRMPIVRQVAEVLFTGKDVRLAVHELMTGELGPEVS